MTVVDRVCADVVDEVAVQAMVGAVESSLGPVDLLVTSAGIARVGRKGEFDLEDWRAMMRARVVLPTPRTPEKSMAWATRSRFRLFWRVLTTGR